MSVSVIIPNYNSAEFIEQCLRSVADDPAASEIVLYDDCSMDGSVEIAQGLQIAKLRILRGDRNLGAALARDAAIRESRNDLLCFLDSDDYLSAGAVSAAHDALVRSNADISLFKLVRVDVGDTRIIDALEPPASPISGRAAFELTLGEWDIHTLGVLRRGIYEAAVRLFTPHGWSDGEVLMRQVLLGASTVSGSSGSYFYRHVPRPTTPERIAGLIRTRLRTIDIASAEGITGRRAGRERNKVVRNLMGTVYKTVTGRMPFQTTAALISEYAHTSAKWRVEDLPYLPPALLLKGAGYASLLLRRDAPSESERRRA
jgi:glycosyltransferase involved in cell wall biosynthesis